MPIIRKNEIDFFSRDKIVFFVQSEHWREVSRECVADVNKRGELKKNGKKKERKMRKFCKRSFSFLLAFCIIFSLTPAEAYGNAGAYAEGESYFDFDAADYTVREDEKSLRVKIRRYGKGGAPANVVVKVADFLSTYGEDYEILLDGKALFFQEGKTINPADFKFDNGESESANSGNQTPKMKSVEPVSGAEVVTEAMADPMPEPPENAFKNANEMISEGVLLSKRFNSGGDFQTNENESEIMAEPVPEAPENAPDMGEVMAEPVPEAGKEKSKENLNAKSKDETNDAAALQSDSPVKRSRSASPLRDMQAAYLQLPKTADAELMEENAPTLFENMHEFFENAQGATGIIYFGPDVRERVLTVRPIDNDKSDGSRMFLLGLLGTDTPETTIAPNATAYVAIEDDDDYEPAMFSIADSEIILTRDQPSAEITITRRMSPQ